MEEQQKEIQYPGWYKDNIGKELWSGECDEVSKGNIKWGIADKISMPRAVFYSLVIDDFDAGQTK